MNPSPLPVPMSEFYCTTKGCDYAGMAVVLEWRDCGSKACCPSGGTHYPICMGCQKVMREVTSAPNVIWTGTLGQRYRDKTKEGYYEPDGQIAWTRNTPDGKPKPVHLNSWQDVHRFSKQEGCLDPRDLPNNMEVNEGGKSVAWRGQKGQEV